MLPAGDRILYPPATGIGNGSEAARLHRAMTFNRRTFSLLAVLGVAAFLLAAALPVLLADTAPGSSVSPVRPIPFVSQGGSISSACDDVDTCTTGAIADVDSGDALVVVVTEYTTSAGHPSLVEEVTSGGDNDLTLLGSTPCIAGSGHGVTAIYGLPNVTAQASVTFTVNYAGDEYYTIHALDVQGVSPAPFETAGTGICSSAAGTTATASATTTAPDDLVILGVEVRGSTTIAGTGGDSLVTGASTTGAELDSGAMLDEIDPGTGAISLSGTFTSASWSAIAIGLKSSPLVSGVVSPATASIDEGQSVAFTSTAASGGSAPISYQWYSTDSVSACSSGALLTGATGRSYTSPGLPVGSDYYCVWTTDSSTPTHLVVYSNVATVTVNPPLGVNVTPPAPSIESGQAVTLSANATGGTGPVSYAWYAGSTCSGAVLATTQNYSTPALSSDTTYCVAVTDSSATPETATSDVTVTVSGSPLSVTISPAAPDLDRGQSVQLTAHPSGGVGADTFAWFLGGACSGTALANGQVYGTGPLSADATYCVQAKDSAATPDTATATAQVNVSSAPLSVAITPNAPSIAAGTTIQLDAVPSGGTGAITFEWYAGTSCSGAVLSTNQTYTTPTMDATAAYCVAAEDSAYVPETATANATVTVSFPPLSVSITPVAPSIGSGQTIVLTARPSGGWGVDTYAWYAGNTCSGSSLSSSQNFTTPALSITSSYCVMATDAAPHPVSATANATVTVTAPSSSSSGGIPPAVTYGVAGIAALLLAALLLAALVRRRRTVTFTETGLPPGTRWSVNFSGTALTSAESSIVVGTSKGAHPYSIRPTPGYSATPPFGTVNVDKKVVEVRIAFAAAVEPELPRATPADETPTPEVVPTPDTPSEALAEPNPLVPTEPEPVPIAPAPAEPEPSSQEPSEPESEPSSQEPSEPSPDPTPDTSTSPFHEPPAPPPPDL